MKDHTVAFKDPSTMKNYIVTFDLTGPVEANIDAENEELAIQSLIELWLLEMYDNPGTFIHNYVTNEKAEECEWE